LRAFESAARTSSFAAAAAELHLTSGAIGYQVRALEAHLGYALFKRLPRGVELTSMGAAYLPSVRKAFEELADSTVSLFGGTQRFKMIVHAPASLTALWLAPQISTYLAGNPGIEIRMSSLVWDNPGPDEAADLEIRYGCGDWPGYRSQLLINQSLMVVGSPALLRIAKRRGEVATFVARNLIANIGYERQWEIVAKRLQLSDHATMPGPTVDTNMAALELAAHGGGFALTHRIYLDGYFESDRLVVAIDRQFPDDHSYYLCTPQRSPRMRGKVQLFRDWLLSAASQRTDIRAP
jgi:LysR family glycine cleavage system transcriptional activator